ncbi:hypothetical protein [uncultured Parabacteroides sp.]|uniref:hypothetical protein n=1 Tax=uncultured Parabacteroides sp. TaxID=512312 RepID=UPI0026E5476C|nr:hypothetical protein [uncultured Parabacteroides sp.]
MAENKKVVVVNLQKLEVAPVGADGAEGTNFEEVPVVHEDTFTYEDEDPVVTDYKDVSGNTYYSSKKPGAVKVNASVGMYELETKTKFQGGKYTAGTANTPGSWERADHVENKEFTVRATTEDGVRIIFPRAGVSASGKSNEKAIGLALVFTALKPTKAGVPIERWEDGEDTTPQG